MTSEAVKRITFYPDSVKKIRYVGTYIKSAYISYVKVHVVDNEIKTVNKFPTY